MKTLVTLWNGALTVTETGGNVTVEISKSAALGGGQAAGAVSVEGDAKITISGKQDFDLLMGALEKVSPAAIVPLEKAAQAAGDAAIGSL